MARLAAAAARGDGLPPSGDLLLLVLIHRCKTGLDTDLAARSEAAAAPAMPAAAARPTAVSPAADDSGEAWHSVGVAAGAGAPSGIDRITLAPASQPAPAAVAGDHGV